MTQSADLIAAIEASPCNATIFIHPTTETHFMDIVRGAGPAAKFRPGANYDGTEYLAGRVGSISFTIFEPPTRHELASAPTTAHVEALLEQARAS